MAYRSSDPRSRLAGSAEKTVTPSAPAQYFDFAGLTPDEISDRGSRTWWVRGQNFALAYTFARAGETFTRTEQPDEYVVLFPREAAAAKISASGDEVSVDGASLVTVPAGHSRITIDADTHVVRLFSAKSPELLAHCSNHLDYAHPHPNIAPFAPWPEPVGGPHLRVYRVADHPYVDGRFGRIFRCTTFMVNLFDPYYGPRDPARLSPHHHDDFEQCSLAVDGQWVHHIRNPWTTNLADWRPDEHVAMASPSVVIIPPPSVHTSQATGQVRNQLIDVFCPPRHDFSAKSGWVINHDDYPVLPADAADRS